MSDTGEQDGRSDQEAVSPVSGGRRLMSGREKVMIGLGLFAAVALIVLWPSSKRERQPEGEQRVEATGRNMPFRPLPEPPASSPVRLPMTATGAPPIVPMPAPEAGQLPLPMMASAGMGMSRVPVAPSPILSYHSQAPAPPAAEPVAGSPPRVAAAPGGAQGATLAPDDTMAARLRPSRLVAARASVLRNPELTVPVGTRIPCIPEMPINSDVAGFFSCVTPVDVRGSTGAVVLMERGTRIVGEVRSSLTRGSRRLYVVMTQALTPGGVEIALDSPAGDILGTAGLDGEVDTHFWQRFGGAMMLAFVDTGLQAAALAASQSMSRDSGGVSFNQFQAGGRDATNTALQADINIPPTLRRNQGELMTVFVARHLDFSDVYRLVSR
jgi:type IV secretion system protein VirB10